VVHALAAKDIDFTVNIPAEAEERRTPSPRADARVTADRPAAVYTRLPHRAATELPTTSAHAP
jgi:hypothetical protein